MKPAQHIIYLDNNATTPIATEVYETITHCLKNNFGNPSSRHVYGVTAQRTVEHARQQVAALIGASPDEIIFTSGGTEANNLAIFGTAHRFRSGHIITSCTEHPAVLKPLHELRKRGYQITYLPVDRYGFVKPSSIMKHIRKDTFLITVMHSNNETGTLQPAGEIGKIARDRDITFHCDAAQSVGKVPVNVKKLRVDLLTIVSHKFYGPKGVGALFVRKGAELLPILYGASHEKGLRPGTENVCFIAGLGMAAELARKELKERVAHMKKLSRMMLEELLGKIPGITLNGHPSQRLPNTLNISFPDITGAALLERLQDKVAASTGSACHEGKHTPSPVLKSMGLSDERALSAVRFSLGRDTTEKQIRKAAKAIVKAYTQNRS